MQQNACRHLVCRYGAAKIKTTNNNTPAAAASTTSEAANSQARRVIAGRVLPTHEQALIWINMAEQLVPSEVCVAHHSLLRSPARHHLLKTNTSVIHQVERAERTTMR
jgi:hypothetical protein